MRGYDIIKTLPHLGNSKIEGARLNFYYWARLERGGKVRETQRKRSSFLLWISPKNIVTNGEWESVPQDTFADEKVGTSIPMEVMPTLQTIALILEEAHTAEGNKKEETFKRAARDIFRLVGKRHPNNQEVLSLSLKLPNMIESFNSPDERGKALSHTQYQEVVKKEIASKTER